MEKGENEWKNPARLWRQARIQDLLKLIQENKETEIDAIIAKMSLKHGLSERKVKEYLKILEAEQKIEIDWLHGKITTKQ
jgi:predicted transcriptional regulator